jgi:hypothetical protein
MKDTALTLPDLASHIRQEHELCEKAARQSLVHAAEAGRLLDAAKEQCGHGGFAKWLAENFPASERTAQTYMRIHRNWDKLESKAQRVADLSLRQAMAILSRPPLIIDPEFAALLPACSPEEDKRLEESILKYGCLTAIIVWKGHNIILDGHRRYKICQEQGVEFEVVEVEADSRLDASIKILRWQLGRKNLSPEEIAASEVAYQKLVAPAGTALSTKV